MVQRELVIRNRAGIHARPAAALVKLAQGFSSSVYLEKDSERINAKSIMGIIALGATYNTALTLTVEGEDEIEAADAIQRLFENKFQED